MVRKVLVTTLVSAVGGLAPSCRAWAEEARMRTTLAVGATLTDGNSDTVQGNVSLITEGENRLGSVGAGAEFNYGESTVEGETDTTTENGKVFAEVKKTLSDRFFAYMGGFALYDNIADIDYRVGLGPGLGVYLLKSEATVFSVETGFSYIWEEVGGLADDYPALRAAESIEHHITKTARLWQAAEYLPQTADFGNYLANAEVGIEAALNAKLSLRFVVQDKYDSKPAAGREKNDVMAIAGISMKL